MYDPILQTDYYQFRAFFEPHNVRTDRVPGQSDTKQDGAGARVRRQGRRADLPVRARQRSRSPTRSIRSRRACRAVLGGDPLAGRREVALASRRRTIPGLRQFVQQETLAAAEAAVESSEQAMLKATTPLADARKTLADFLAATAEAAADGKLPRRQRHTARNADAEKPAEKPAEAKADGPSEAGLKTAIAEAEADARLAEQDVLAAAAELVAVRAKIAADDAAFATSAGCRCRRSSPAKPAAPSTWPTRRSSRSATLARLEQELAR